MRTKPIIYLVLLALGLYLIAGAYPPAKLEVPESDLIFAHANHIDLECTDCHIDITTSTSASDRNLPGMDVCGNCHDVEDFDNCSLCHKNADEPGGIPEITRPIRFNHKSHLDRGTDCLLCHKGIDKSEKPSTEYMPTMALCMTCHDNTTASADCALCHENKITLFDIHPADWRHQHGDRAAADPEYCNTCHHNENFCIECHRGDNLSGNIHDLNYVYTHGLDAKSDEHDCSRCHDNRSFCNACHEQENRIPLLHSTAGWLTDHGQAARNDVENCASCHDSSDPTCARAGCHSDFDGIRGTDPRIHPGGSGQLEIKGPWHSDDGYFCFQCHVGTNTPGMGFCGYCHN